MALDLELHVGGEVRQQLQVGIFGGDHDRVGHDVLRHRGVQANLLDHAAEDIVGKRVDRERHRGADFQLPMSASLTEAQTCMRRKSLAIRNRLGAFRLETTVWPMLTRRSMIVPSTGDLMIV